MRAISTSVAAAMIVVVVLVAGVAGYFLFAPSSTTTTNYQGQTRPQTSQGPVDYFASCQFLKSDINVRLNADAGYGSETANRGLQVAQAEIALLSYLGCK